MTVAGALGGERWSDHQVRPRALFLTPSRCASRWVKPAPSRHINLYFSAAVPHDVADSLALPHGVWQQPLINVPSPQLAPVIDLLVSEMRSPDEGDAAAIDALTRLLLIRLLRQMRHPASQAERLTRRLLRTLDDYIDGHLGNRIMVAELASAIDMSPARLTRALARQLNISPHRYVMRRRLDSAARMLTSTGRSLIEIAASSGYASQQHMTSAFSRHLGITPNAFRTRRQDSGPTTAHRDEPGSQSPGQRRR